MRWILDGHANIAMSQRTQLWPKFYRAFGPLSDPDNLDECIAAMQGRKQVERLNPDWEALRADFLQGPPTYARLFAGLHSQLADRSGARRWGDQSSNLDRYAHLILTAYPEARIINMLRDPLDTYAALEEKNTRRLSGAGAFAAGWSHAARRAADNERQWPDRYKVVRYEDLVTDPESTMSDVFRFVGEPFSEALLQIRQADRYESLRQESERGWAVSRRFLGIGQSLSRCTRGFIADATSPGRSLWGYDRAPAYPVDAGNCTLRQLWDALTRFLEATRLSMASKPPPEAESYSSALRSWHRLTDSDGFRHAVKRGKLSGVFGSDMYRRADIARRRILVRLDSSQPDFGEVRTFTMFVGHNKSGTSLLGALLDANRRVVLSDEADALKYVDAGVSGEELYRILFRASRSEARKGRVTARRLGAYSYAVPGQWQGRADRPLVVGDSMSGTTTRRLSDRPELIGAVEQCVGPAALRVLQVVRNPFDPISLMVIRGNRSIANSIDHYFRACQRLVDIEAHLGEERLLKVYYEDLVREPSTQLKRVGEYLGFDTATPYLDACAAVVEKGFEDSRGRIEWHDRWIEEVETRIEQFDFLQGYTFESHDRAPG